MELAHGSNSERTNLNGKHLFRLIFCCNTVSVFGFMTCDRVSFISETPQQKEADANSMSCEDKCFPDCMTNDLNECVEACQRFCPAI